MNKENILIEKKGKVAIITINRPEKMNAFDESLFISLEAVTVALQSELPRAVIITGVGNKSFSSGFDVHPDNPMVKRIIDAAKEKDSESAKKLISTIRKSVDGFLSIPVPIIAALNGSAYGGGAELAMRCDMRVIDPDAVICFSETRLGLMPDWGGGAALARLAGPSRAMDLVLTARKINSEEAYSMGIVNRISEKGQSLEMALTIAEMISSNGPRSVRNALMLIRESQIINYTKQLDLEAELAASLISSGECFHGVGAFIEKRKPLFPDID